jgi:hypothetical protein
MGITASKGNGDYERFLFTPGRYDAVCFQVVDLGTQVGEWQGKKIKSRKCLIGFEIPSEMMEFEDEHGQQQIMPRVISRQLTISLSPKGNMRPLLESWRGKSFSIEEEMAFDISKLLKKTCELQIINKTSKTTGEQYNFIQNMLTPRDGVKTVEPLTPIVYFSFEDNMEIPSMPDWIRDIIRNSLEYIDMNSAPDPNEPPPIGDDDIPF